MLQMTAKLTAKLLALKHSVFSKGKAPWEDANEFEANRTKWREHFKPFDPLLEGAAEEVAMMDWLRRRNRNSLVLYALCEPFGQLVAQHQGQEWTDAASKLLKKRDEDFSSIIDAHKCLTEWAKASNDPKLEKRILKELASIKEELRRIANVSQLSLEFFMGIGEENAKQAERATQLNAGFQKLYTQYLQLEEYLIAKNKLHPPRIEHLEAIESKNSDGG
jgi:hypothetical protein